MSCNKFTFLEIVALKRATIFLTNKRKDFLLNNAKRINDDLITAKMGLSQGLVWLLFSEILLRLVLQSLFRVNKLFLQANKLRKGEKSAQKDEQKEKNNFLIVIFCIFF